MSTVNVKSVADLPCVESAFFLELNTPAPRTKATSSNRFNTRKKRTLLGRYETRAEAEKVTVLLRARAPKGLSLTIEKRSFVSLADGRTVFVYVHHTDVPDSNTDIETVMSRLADVELFRNN